MAGGRKLEFDRGAALKAAMTVFWEKGYAGASLSDLTDSMGINKPSMYNAFGNKEELFIKATHYYAEEIAGIEPAFLNEKGLGLAARLKNFLMPIVKAQCDPSHPLGCFVAFSLPQAVSGVMPDGAGATVKTASEGIPELLNAVFQEDAEAASLGLNRNAETNALCLAATLAGTASMARSGKTIDELEAIIDNALRGLGLVL